MAGDDLEQEIRDIVRTVTDTIEDYGDELKLIPYIKQGVALLTKVRLWRIRVFFRSLDGEREVMSEKEKQRFKKIIESEAGQELLADFVDTVTRTSSRLACAALALLYASNDTDRNSATFKLRACRALDGASDEMVNFLLALRSVRDLQPEKPEDRIHRHYLNDTIVAQVEPIARLNLSDGAVVGYLSDLIRRGILLPDPKTAILGMTDKDEWQIVFSAADDTWCFVELLERARDRLPNDI